MLTNYEVLNVPRCKWSLATDYIRILCVLPAISPPSGALTKKEDCQDCQFIQFSEVMDTCTLPFTYYLNMYSFQLSQILSNFDLKICKGLTRYGIEKNIHPLYIVIST